MHSKVLFSTAMLFYFGFCHAQLSGEDFDRIDSMIARTAHVPLCKKNGKDDVRFMNRAPEKYSSYREDFTKLIDSAFTFPANSNFFCDITAEINCEGKAGNYDFAIEPRTFDYNDFKNFKQLMALVEKLRNYTFKPAVNLGENVNSSVRFRLMAKNGKALITAVPKR